MRAQQTKTKMKRIYPINNDTTSLTTLRQPLKQHKQVLMLNADFAKHQLTSQVPFKPQESQNVNNVRNTTATTAAYITPLHINASTAGKNTSTKSLLRRKSVINKHNKIKNKEPLKNKLEELSKTEKKEKQKLFLSQTKLEDQHSNETK